MHDTTTAPGHNGHTGAPGAVARGPHPGGRRRQGEESFQVGKTLPEGLAGPDGTLPRAGAEGHIKVQLSGFYKCTGYDMRSWRLSPLRGSYEATCEATRMTLPMLIWPLY